MDPKTGYSTGKRSKRRLKELEGSKEKLPLAKARSCYPGRSKNSTSQDPKEALRVGKSGLDGKNIGGLGDLEGPSEVLEPQDPSSGV
jgi:hypothetical protein